MINDPIADMLTRIRNAVAMKYKTVEVLSSKMSKEIANILTNEGYIDGFEEKINASNERMDTLKAEIEKRNPTPVEKLSLRSKNSYPFNVSPEEYWKDKEMTSNYRFSQTFYSLYNKFYIFAQKFDS